MTSEMSVSVYRAFVFMRQQLAIACGYYYACVRAVVPVETNFPIWGLSQRSETCETNWVSLSPRPGDVGGRNLGRATRLPLPPINSSSRRLRESVFSSRSSFSGLVVRTFTSIRRPLLSRRWQPDIRSSTCQTCTLTRLIKLSPKRDKIVPSLGNQ